MVKSSGKFRGSKRLSLCWMENGSLVGSEEGGAAGAEMDRGGTISEQKQRPDTRTCPWIGCGGSCECPRAAGTRYYQLGGLKQQKCIRSYSGGWKSQSQGLSRAVLHEAPSSPPPASGCSKHCSACGHVLAISASVFPRHRSLRLLGLCPNPCLLLRTPATGPTLSQHDIILAWLPLPKPRFQDYTHRYWE